MASKSFLFKETQAIKKLLLMTKLTVLFVFLGFAQVLAVESYAQMTRLSMKVNDQSIEEVLEEIEDASEFFFFVQQRLNRC